jgi:hypothetical protein
VVSAADEARAWIGLLERYGVSAGTSAARQLAGYRELLRKWNARVSLTGSTEWPALAPLFEEALWAARVVRGVEGLHVDIGSGGGFPAIPMKILAPEVGLTLVESRERKAIFLERVIGELGLAGAIVKCCRLDTVLSGYPEGEGPGLVSWKALRLARADWSRLLERCGEGTKLLLFHGEALSVEDPGAFSEATVTLERLSVPGRDRSWLSIVKATGKPKPGREAKCSEQRS